MLSLFVIYLAAHFLLYVVVLRRLRVFRSEKIIFLYHLVPGVLVSLTALAWLAAQRWQPGFAEWVVALSVHGIYSLSFLELWSLAQGGYSLSVIAAIAGAQAGGTEVDFRKLEEIGRTKQRERVTGLVRMGLIADTGGRLVLTARGRKVATLLYRLHAWVDPDSG